MQEKLENDIAHLAYISSFIPLLKIFYAQSPICVSGLMKQAESGIFCEGSVTRRQNAPIPSPYPWYLMLR